MSVPVPDILDNDLYKFLMQQFLLKYPEYDVPVEYTLTLRKQPQYPFNSKFEQWFFLWLNHFTYSMPLLTPKQASWMSSIPGMQPWYINWLRGFKPNNKEVEWSVKDGDLTLKVRSPKWSRAIWWEVPLMGGISELYNASVMDTEDVVANCQLLDKLDNERFWKLGNANIVEFGTRRRFSLANQRRVIDILRNYPCYKGTSNVMLAFENNEIPKGTMAHELFMGIAPLVGYKRVYEVVLNKWYNLYNPHYLIALPDTFGSQHFFDNTPDSLYYMYDGMRQDSGRMDSFSGMYIRRLEKASFSHEDMSKKRIIFSNSLKEDHICSARDTFKMPITNLSFGWGTGLTNSENLKEHIESATALNMVIKLSCVWKGNIIQPTVKISDDPTKATGPTHIIESITKGERA